MSSAGDISDALSKIEEYLQPTSVNITEKCTSAKQYFETEDGSVNPDKLKELLSHLQELYGHLPQFTSGDPNQLLLGVVGVVSSVSSLTGLGAPVVPVICGVLSKVFSSFGGNTVTIGKVVEDEIKRTFSGHNDETLQQEGDDLHLLYRFAFDFLNQTGGKADLSEHDITNINIQMNIFQGATFLRKLGKLIKELAKEHKENDQNKKIEKAKKAMQFIELYIKLASLRDMILSQFYTITNSTAHSQHLAGGIQRVIGSFDEQDREALSMFLKPTKEYVYIVSYIKEENFDLLMKFLEQKNLLQDQSWITQGDFELCSVKWMKYHATHLKTHTSFFGEGDLRFLRGSKEKVGPESLFCFEKVRRKGNYVYIKQRESSDEFVSMTKGSDRWLMSVKEQGPECEWKVIQMENGNFVFSPHAFPDYFMGMSKLLDGSLAGFLGCSSRRCHWTLRASK
ncbi:uncharacterized protein LOC110465492 [Mizuhopecten yessoensis]|uniref:uncharacterized protein LOC110465492 n=1 Tax=Mizuhopecten yessoensis TaxID=6573 RepID=UPI000B45E018|nr:uncharacterized protein LOC110465492 [Mizuhopecten yessoensis]